MADTTPSANALQALGFQFPINPGTAPQKIPQVVTSQQQPAVPQPSAAPQPSQAQQPVPGKPSSEKQNKPLTLADIRKQYPNYNSVPDDKLVHALHEKYYSSVPFDTFADKIGYKPATVPDDGLPWDVPLTGRQMRAGKEQTEKADKALDKSLGGTNDLARNLLSPIMSAGQTALGERPLPRGAEALQMVAPAITGPIGAATKLPAASGTLGTALSLGMDALAHKFGVGKAAKIAKLLKKAMEDGPTGPPAP
jgi:hypothetical protein